ncbi:MAG: hypothetical protein Q9214_000753 [Letrouitia sp. 1 TL-2023]
MSFNIRSPPIASAAIFCPQSKAPGEGYLEELHAFLHQNHYLRGFVQDILSLRDTWAILASTREDIAGLSQGPRYIQNLADWICTGQSSKIANCMSGILSLPLLVIIQVSQYFQYLELYGLSHSQLAEKFRAGGGIQGYCGGLCPALAIACSRDEAEIVERAAVAMRIALAIGAYGELGDDESMEGATTIVVRLKMAGQGEKLVARFPGSYISAVTDPKTISIVGPAPVLLKIQSSARSEGMLVNAMHIRGKVHNPENEELARELCQLCDRSDLFRLPDASSLRVPSRSNRTGELITEGSLAHEMVRVVLASRCEWYTLLTRLAEDLDVSGRRRHTFATLGIGDCVPLSPFHKLQLQITKVDVQRLVAQHACQSQPDEGKCYQYPPDAIAIVGASCRFPSANSLDQLWDLISSGASVHTKVPKGRFDLHGSFRASQDRRFMENRHFYGNFIDNADCFDHAFFNTNPKETANMDPQQRVLLELAYQALDSSGYLKTHRRESGDPVGCFIGASFAEYLDNTNAYAPTAYTSTGTIRAFLCGKISYCYGWSGPSEVIDTACSSSLVAINRACKAIQMGECTMALAGGVNVMTGINNFIDLAKAGFLSPSGQCKPFDQAADGYCRSEGGGLVVLKPLNQAVSDGDQIFGLIPGMATNQGGLSASITIPHSPAQAKLFRTILRQADMKPGQVTYVETHGTGTQAGDPLEIASVRQVFGGQDRDSVLNIGSLKGNIGHAETAAGVASLLKVLTMIQKASIPPQASYQSLNSKIPLLEVDKMAIATKAAPWKGPILAASVNSYGAAGSNAALICCEYSPPKLEKTERPSPDLIYPIIVSASSRESLDLNIQSLASYLEKSMPPAALGDVAFTLSGKRKLHRHVFATTAADTKSLVQNLNNKSLATVEMPQTPKRVVLVFGGQTRRSVGMNRTIYESYPQLRSYVDDCDRIMVDLGYSTLLPSMFQLEALTNVVALQCGTFAMQYACAQCWIQAGLRVDAVVGHSFGELTALVVSGKLSLRDGLRLITCRASLMETQWGREKGTMLAIHGNREIVQDVLASINDHLAIPDVEVACYNASTSQVIVGSTEAIVRTQDLLRSDPRFTGIRSQQLDVTHGFHSKFTEGILAELNDCSASLTYCESEIPLETCTAQANDTTCEYRPSQHAREPVYFSDAIQRIEKRLGPCIWLESGMDSAIISMTKRAVARPDQHLFQEMDSRAPLSTLGKMTVNLWQEGISASYWSFASRQHPFRQIWLPPYQFQPSRHWVKHVDRAVEVQEDAAIRYEALSSSTLVIPKPRPTLVQHKAGTSKNSQDREFRICVAAERFTKIVSGHAVRQRPLCPASMYMECATMGLQLFEDIGNRSLRFSNLSFETPLGADPTRECFLTFTNLPDVQGWSFTVKSLDSKSKPSTSAKGEIMLIAQPDLKIYGRLIADRIDDLNSRSNLEKLRSNRAYGLFSRVVHYADFFQAISQIALDKNEAIAEINLSDAAEIEFGQSTATRYCETVAIDAFIQVVGLLINSSTLVGRDDVYVATGVDNASMSAACDFHKEKSWTVYARYQSTKEGQAAGDIFIMTCKGMMAMVIIGAQFTRLPMQKLERLLDTANSRSSSSAAARNEGPPLEIASSDGSLSEDSLASSSGKSGTGTPETALSSGSSSDSLEDSPEKAQGQQAVFALLSEISGAPVHSISGKPTLQDLGIDSLSAVELKDDLENKFDVVIEDDKFTLESTVQEILSFLGIAASSGGSLPGATTPLAKDTAGGGLVDGSPKASPPQKKAAELANPAEAFEKSHEAFNEAAAKHGFLTYWTDVAPEQDELLLAYICEAFEAQGSDIRQVLQGQQIPMISHLSKHAKVVDRLIQILEKHDLVTRQGSTLIRGCRPTPSKHSQEIHHRFIKKFPAYSGEAQLMALTGTRLADCLVGEVDAVSLMFRHAAAQKIMGDYYCESPMLSTLTDQMVTFIERVVMNSRNTSSDRPIQILEVGAGFGGTTTRLAAMLHESGVPVAYTFTDISASLVMGAKSRFARYPWVQFQPLNLEKDMPTALRNTYDMIIGTNCVHATTNRATTIGRLKSLLNEQGFIVLSEVTQLVDWYDIVFGLLDGWWLANDGSTYPLQPPESWMQSFEQAGFDRTQVTYSQGSSRESNTQRLLLASNKHKVSAIKSPSDAEEERPSMQTVVYKSVNDVEIEADVYLPVHLPAKSMSVAIMIHGGGHMTLSRKAVRPLQTAFLLAHGVLPVSIDYRLCPEVNLTEGPIQDVCDAYAWVQSGGLQAALRLRSHGVPVDGGRIVVIGWSTGGHLAMTTAWTSKQAGLRPPVAILSFYGPTDFESGDLDVRRAEEYPERHLPMDEIIASLPTVPITNYSTLPASTDRSHLGWIRPGDPRSELVLSLFKEGNGLPLLLNGIRPSASSASPYSPPSPERIASISPLAQVRNGTYTTPTCLIHGTRDEIVPFETAEAFLKAMQEAGVKGRLGIVEGARHIHDLRLKENDEGWWEGVGVGYNFLFKELGIKS